MDPKAVIDPGMRGVSRPTTAEIVAFATGRHDIVARRHLLAMGVSKSSVQRLIDRRFLYPRFHGVYSVGPTITQRGWWMAAVDACGDRAVLSYWSAAALWDLLAPLSVIDVSRPGCRRSGPDGLRVHNVRELNPAEHGTIDGIPVTSLARTVLDIAAGPKRQLRRAWDEAERRELIDMREVQAVLANHPRHPGRNAFERLIEEAADPRQDIRSEMEHIFWELVLDEQLTLPLTNLPFGPYTVDCYWPHAKLVVELDSRTFHERRMAFEEDRERDGYLLEHYDIRVYRITWNALTRRRPTVVARLRKLLATT